MLRSLHSRSVAEADTEEAVVVVSMEEVAEAASTVEVGAADSMEAVAVLAAVRTAAEVAAFIAVAAVRTAAVRRVAPVGVRTVTAEAAGTRRADTAARMAVGDPAAHTAVARDRAQGVRIR